MDSIPIRSASVEAEVKVGSSEGHGACREGSAEACARPGGLCKQGGGVKHRREPTVAVCRRNERERNRVQQVNLNFERLRRHVPAVARNKKLSKMDTLRSAVNYIQYLKDLLDSTDTLLPPPPPTFDPDPLPPFDLDPLPAFDPTSTSYCDSEPPTGQSSGSSLFSGGSCPNLNDIQLATTPSQPVSVGTFNELPITENSFAINALAENAFIENVFREKASSAFMDVAFKENVFTGNEYDSFADSGVKCSSLLYETKAGFALMDASDAMRGDWCGVGPAAPVAGWSLTGESSGPDCYQETDEKVRDCLLRELTAWLMQ